MGRPFDPGVYDRWLGLGQSLPWQPACEVTHDGGSESVSRDVPKARSSSRRGTSWARVCARALELPGVEQGTSYGTPSLTVRRKFLARLKEDGETVAIRIDFPERELLLELDPSAFYLTDHYRNYPAVLVRLKQVRPGMMDDIVEQAWRRQAPKSLTLAGRGAKRRRSRAD
jgi:hypothetical protein